jgi:hypothetical protein
VITFSKYKIIDPDKFDFDPTEYSKFKFGDGSISRKYGENLAVSFINTHGEQILNEEKVTVISSPYTFIPTATFSMKIHFVNHVNKWLVKNQKPVLHETKVNRSITYREDYGNLTADERIKLIGNDRFYIDAQVIKDHTLLFMDDIRITGSHEKMILKMIDEFSLTNNIFLLYFAELTNPQIHPNIENKLNHACVKNLHDLFLIIDSPDFVLNTRVVKFILNSNENHFDDFINKLRLPTLENIFHAAIGNSYHMIPEYGKNLKKIEEKIS